ncbi:hypothetical protein [Nostoc sp.]|uniref:hypothetical protein n=1 Tax=Nostoc sp. TaxID=1180 RepID=UPI002FF23F53
MSPKIRSLYIARRVRDISLKPQPISPVPEETVRVARAAFPKGTFILISLIPKSLMN